MMVVALAKMDVTVTVMVAVVMVELVTMTWLTLRYYNSMMRRPRLMTR